MSEIVVTSLEQTCGSCPSQWEGEVADGRTIYVRYRNGYLSVRVSAWPTSDVDEAVTGLEVVGKQVGGRYDGTMSYDELREVTTGSGIEWPPAGDWPEWARGDGA